jgi:hypothetical protein
LAFACIAQEYTQAAGELKAHFGSIIDVPNYVNKTYSLFGEAQRMRPDTLLKPKK